MKGVFVFGWCLWLLAPVVAGQNQTWVVGTGPGRDFVTIASALAAVSPGDTLLVRAGTYRDPLIIDKPITIQAERDADVLILNRVEVANLTGGSVQVRGLDMAVGLRIRDAAGLVWIEDCLIQDYQEDLVFGIENASDVVLIGTRVEARDDWGEDQVAQSALVISGGSDVQAFACTFTDAEGLPCAGGVWCYQPGGTGILASDSEDFMFLSNCTSVGGNGAGNFWGGFCSSGGVGFACAGQGVVIDSDLRAGTAYCDPVLDYSGNIELCRTPALRFSVASPVREDEPVTLSFDGPPSARVYLVSVAEPLGVYLPFAHGVLTVAAPRTVQFIGVTDRTGNLSTTLPHGSLPAGSDSESTFLQAAYLDYSAPLTRSISRTPLKGTMRLGSGSMLLTLDESF